MVNEVTIVANEFSGKVKEELQKEIQSMTSIRQIMQYAETKGMIATCFTINGKLIVNCKSRMY